MLRVFKLLFWPIAGSISGLFGLLMILAGVVDILAGTVETGGAPWWFISIGAVVGALGFTACIRGIRHIRHTSQAEGWAVKTSAAIQEAEREEEKKPPKFGAAWWSYFVASAIFAIVVFSQKIRNDDVGHWVIVVVGSIICGFIIAGIFTGKRRSRTPREYQASADDLWSRAIQASDANRQTEAAQLFAAAVRSNPWKYCGVGHNSWRPAKPHQQSAWLQGMTQAGFAPLADALFAPQQSSATLTDMLSGARSNEQLLEEICARLQIKKS